MCGSSMPAVPGSDVSIFSSQVLPLRDEPKIHASRSSASGPSRSAPLDEGAAILPGAYPRARPLIQGPHQAPGVVHGEPLPIVVEIDEHLGPLPPAGDPLRPLADLRGRVVAAPAPLAPV